jgi:hypothetical protein
MTSRIVVEVEVDGGSLVDMAFFAREVRKQIREYVFHPGQDDEWKLIDHVVSIKATAIQETDD